MERIRENTIQWRRIRNRLEEEMDIDEGNLEDPIIKSDFEIALKELKNIRAPEIDRIQSEILKIVWEEVKNRLFKFVFSIILFNLFVQ